MNSSECSKLKYINFLKRHKTIIIQERKISYYKKKNSFQRKPIKYQFHPHRSPSLKKLPQREYSVVVSLSPARKRISPRWGEKQKRGAEKMASPSYIGMKCAPYFKKTPREREMIEPPPADAKGARR